jgi:hypothetical protein
MHQNFDSKIDRLRGTETRSVPEKHGSKPKDRQRLKIKEIGAALYEAGHVSLDEQARVLGLSRSTTHAILQANHKSTGLTAVLINRMLKSPRLPSAVRAKILQYAEEKAAGLYGHTDRLRRKFINSLYSTALPTQKQRDSV